MNIDGHDDFDSIDWTEARRNCLEFLLSGIHLPQFNSASNSDAKAIYGFDGSDSYLRSCRRQCGGNTLEVERGTCSSYSQATNSLIRLVNRYAIEICAIYQVKDQPTLWSIDLRHDDLSRALVRDIAQVPEISKLVPNSHDGWIEENSASFYCASANRAGAVYLGLSAYSLMTDCVMRCLISGESLSVERIRAKAPQVVSDYISQIRGDEVHLPAAIGLVGGTLRPNEASSHCTTVSVGDGYIRSARESDSILFRLARDQPGAVWVTSQPSRLVASSRPFDDTLQMMADLQGKSAGLQDLITRWKNTSHAIMLASEAFPPPCLEFSEVFISNGVEGNEVVTSAQRTTPIEFRMREYDGECFGDPETWLRKISAHHGSLEIARERLSLSLTERTRPADALLDAIVAWESIFGSNSDTQLRNLLPAALILSSPENRRETFNAMKRVYNLRSTLVHGSQVPESVNIGAAAACAQKWVLEILREIYQNRPELIEVKNSSDRSLSILLGM